MNELGYYKSFNWVSLFYTGSVSEANGTPSFNGTPLKKANEVPSVRVVQLTNSPPSINKVNQKFVELIPNLYCIDRTLFSDDNGQIDDLLKEFERKLSKNDASFAHKIRSYIASVLNRCATHKEALMELGLILYCFDNNEIVSLIHACPSNRSIIDFIGRRLEKILEQLVSSQVEDLPSGKIDYLLSTFAKMVVTSERTLNRGGILAIQALLQSPYRLALYLKSEHLEHILIICDQLMNQSAFKALFKREFSIASSMENFIRIDLKLPPNEQIIPAHAICDCVKALFWDVRQICRVDCYAISSLIYMSENRAYRLMQKMIQFVSTGALEFDEGNVPLLPILEKRLEHPKNSNPTRSIKSFLYSYDVSQLIKVLNLEIPNFFMNEKLSLKELLYRLLKENNALNHLDYAKEWVRSSKYNGLIQLFLAACEFTHMNKSHKIADQNFWISPKKNFIRKSIENLKESVCSNLTDKRETSLFFRVLKKQLSQNIWFIPCYEVKRKPIDLLKIRVMNHSRKDIKSLISVFIQSLRVFYKKDSTLIHSTSEIQKLFSSVLIDSEERLKFFNYNDLYRQKSLIEKAIFSNRFRLFLSNHCSRQICKEDTLSKILNCANLFIYDQVGGHEYLLIKQMFNLEIEREIVERKSNAYELLKKLAEKFKKYDIDRIQKVSRLLITAKNPASVGHAWTVTPKNLKLLIENRNQFYKFVHRDILQPGKTLLQQEIPLTTLFRIINRFSHLEKYPELYDQFVVRHQSCTYRSFRDALLTSKLVEKAIAEEVIDEEFSVINLDKQKITKILFMLNIKVNSKSFIKIYQRLAARKNYLPRTLSNYLREILIEQQIRVIDPYEIELAICKTYRLPITIEMGDLNWSTYYVEDPEHTHLVIKLSWITEKLEFRARKSVDYRDPQVEFHSFKMSFP